MESQQNPARLRVKPPQQLLDLSQPAAPQQAIADTNDLRSPLLALPAEIRVEIFEYVLGGLTIEAATTPARLSLDLLRVCRRIYSEAALLPFQRNTFVIHTTEGFLSLNCPTLQRFLDSLAREQREALAHVAVAGAACFLKTHKGQIARLNGLRSIHIVQRPLPGLVLLYDALVSSWANAGGRPREWRRLELAHLQSVRVSIEVRFDEVFEKFQRSVVEAQTRPLTGLLGMVEGRLFESLTGREIPGEQRGGDDDRFQEKLSSMRGFYR